MLDGLPSPRRRELLDRVVDDLAVNGLVEVADSYTLIPLDQPARFAEVVWEFTRS